MNWIFLVFKISVLGAQHKNNSVKFKPASSLVVPCKKHFLRFPFLECWTGGGAKISTYCDDPVRLKASIQKIIQQGTKSSLRWCSGWRIGLVVLLLEFDVVPCLSHLALTKKPNMNMVVQVQEFFQLIQNSSFSTNNKTNYLKILKSILKFTAYIGLHSKLKIYKQ